MYYKQNITYIPIDSSSKLQVYKTGSSGGVVTGIRIIIIVIILIIMTTLRTEIIKRRMPGPNPTGPSPSPPLVLLLVQVLVLVLVLVLVPVPTVDDRNPALPMKRNIH